VLWLPLGTREEASIALRDRQDVRDYWFESRKEDESGNAVSFIKVMRYGLWDLSRGVIDVTKLARKYGTDSRWVYEVVDPLMIYLLLPALFIAAGAVLEGPLGALIGFGCFVSMWGGLIAILRRSISTWPPADPRTVLTLPNVITGARLATLWLFPVLMMDGHHLRAAVLFAALAATDWADGFVARNYATRTRIGTMLDPAVDRIMMLVVFIALLRYRFLWFDLGLALIARELAAMVLAVLIFRPRGADQNPRAEVHWTGKLAFAATALSVIFLLSVPPLPQIVRTVSEVALLVCLLVSCFALAMNLRMARTGPVQTNLR
jgi:cardiolipin synthase